MYGLIFTGYHDVSRPSGAYRIASHIRKTGWDIEVVDMISYWRHDELVELLKSRYRNGKLKWIGFTATFESNHNAIIQVIEIIRSTYKDIKIIIGGQDIFTRRLDADYYINGFAENAIDLVLKHAFSNGKLPTIPVNKKYYINANLQFPADKIEDLSVQYEARDFLTPHDSLVMEFARGCKFKCKYCSFPFLNVKDDNSRSEESLYNELMYYYDTFGIQNFAVADETINDRPAKLQKVANVVSKLKHDTTFSGYIRADLVASRPNEKQILKDANIRFHFYGIESFNPKSCSLIGKSPHVDRIKESLIETKNFFEKDGLYRGHISLIVGLPYETPMTLSETERWLINNWVGQSWEFVELGLTKQLETTDGFLKLSAFGEDFAKYGYREIEARPEKLLVHIHNQAAFYDNIKTVETQYTMWENDCMNIYDAFDFIKLHMNSYGHLLGLSNFYTTSMLALGLDMERILKIRYNDKTASVLDKMMRNKADWYINKKLDYS